MSACLTYFEKIPQQLLMFSCKSISEPYIQAFTLGFLLPILLFVFFFFFFFLSFSEGGRAGIGAFTFLN